MGCHQEILTVFFNNGSHAAKENKEQKENKKLRLVRGTDLFEYHYFVAETRKCDLYIHSQMRLHDVVLNQLNTFTWLHLCHKRVR